MNNEDLRAALLSGEPVIYKGIIYSCVSAIIYRKNKKGGVYMQVELADKNGNSVTIAAPDRIKRFKEDK